MRKEFGKLTVLTLSPKEVIKTCHFMRKLAVFNMNFIAILRQPRYPIYIVTNWQCALVDYINFRRTGLNFI